jgi:hypothetical protein
MAIDDDDRAPTAQERTDNATARAELARQRAVAAREHAARDTARGIAGHAAMHLREAELHETLAVLQDEAAEEQRRHADAE